MTAFRLINFRGLSPQRKAPPTTGRQTRESAWSSIQKPHTAPNAAFRKISVLPTRPSRLRTNKERRTMRKPTASPPCPRPARRAHSPSIRHRKNLPVPAIPRSISQNAKSAGQGTSSGVPPSPVIPSGARITHTHTRAGQGAISQRPRHEPPRPARSFAFNPSSKSPACSLSRALFRRTQRAPDRERTQASRPHPSSHPARKLRCTQTHAGQSPVHGIPAMSRSIRRALTRLWLYHCSSMRRISSFFCSAAMKSSMLICPALY